MTAIRALLLDLDDTLLVNDPGGYTGAYMRLLFARLGSLCPPVRLMEAFQRGTAAMMRNDGRDGTNCEAFHREFLPRVGCTMEDLAPLVEAFYAEEYETLRQYTSVDPAARRLVALARVRGFQVAIATQPLFPRVAIAARLRWADVPDEEFHYDYVSSYEIQRACKPHRAFFDAILRHLGRRPQECLMVGDSAEADLPAARLGMRTFWVRRSPGSEAELAGVSASAWGTLEDLIAHLETGDIHAL